MSDTRQISIPGVEPSTAAPAARSSRRARAVHFEAHVKAERRPVRVTIDGGVVRFRPRGSHSPYDLEFDTWAGLGYWHAVKAAAAAARADRRSRRAARRIGGAA